MIVNDFANIQFSRDGNKLFFQLSPIRPVKDTNLVDLKLPGWTSGTKAATIFNPSAPSVGQELRRIYGCLMKGVDKVTQLGWEDEKMLLSLTKEMDPRVSYFVKGNRCQPMAGFNFNLLISSQ
jgi:hypothetical protein